METFWLGTHMPSWLQLTDVPLFISRVRLHERKSFPRALAPWALDSGGFSEIGAHGKWTVPPQQYAAEVRRFRDGIGQLAWAAVQDWMCEPIMLHKTGLTVAEHQQRTVESYETLTWIAPDLPWVPVIQGWEATDYLRHVDLYERRGHDLRRFPIVGIGSVCRRQATDEAEAIIREISHFGVNLHGFGFKVLGLRKVSDALVSADSMAWSDSARRKKLLLPECVGSSHACCNNCLRYALKWRAEMLGSLPPMVVPEGPRLRLAA